MVSTIVIWHLSIVVFWVSCYRVVACPQRGMRMVEQQMLDVTWTRSMYRRRVRSTGTRNLVMARPPLISPVETGRDSVLLCVTDSRTATPLLDATSGHLSLIHISEPTRRTPISYA